MLEIVGKFFVGLMVGISISAVLGLILWFASGIRSHFGLPIYAGGIITLGILLVLYTLGHLIETWS